MSELDPIYKIISADYREKVEEEVSDYLRKGWKLHGNLVVVAKMAGGREYSQAVVK